METDRALRGLGYKVLRDLGQGAFSTVKLAKSEKQQKEVAIKIMHKSKHSRRELAILKRVQHPHIVEVHEMFDLANGQVVCIVMEAAVTNLSKKIDFHTVIPNDQARMWFSQLVSAVVYLHKQNITHGDLKCENILLTADNQVKLIDFGFGQFSRGFPCLSLEYSCTPDYAAPEVLFDRLNDPKKADVWSLGVILYKMVVGRLPFREWPYLPGCHRKPVFYPERLEEPCRALISDALQYSYFKRPSVKKVAQHTWLQTEREPEADSSKSMGLPIQSQSSSQSRPASSPRVQVLQKENIDQEEAGPSTATCSSNRDKTPQPHPTAAQDVKSLQPVEEEPPPSSSSLIGAVDMTSSSLSSSEDGLEFVSAQSSIEKEIQSPSSLIKEKDRTSSSSLSTPKDGLEFVRAQSSIEKEVQPETEDSSSRAGGREMCRGTVEVVEEDMGCFSFGHFGAAVKRAAQAYIAAPVVRASRSLRGKIKRLFKVNFVRRNSSSSSSAASQLGVHPSASPAEAPACLCSEEKLEKVVKAEDVLPQPAVKKEIKKQKFLQFKMLKKMKKAPCR